MTLKLTQLNPLSFILPLAQLKHPKKYMVSPDDKTLKFMIDKLSRLKIMEGEKFMAYQTSISSSSYCSSSKTIKPSTLLSSTVQVTH